MATAISIELAVAAIFDARSVADGIILGWLALQQPMSWPIFPQVDQVRLHIRLVCFLGIKLMLHRLVRLRCDDEPAPMSTLREKEQFDDHCPEHRAKQRI